ncbi:general secretion pathway protein K [Comamonas sp. BIGb0124]|uniref:type II secretion system minor pseudopilin GspK n=1 Tax=Comamonas sp. BIGb0124 TaxID=2485130 RepID=UPI000FC3854F|nr:type II secretion system minor pseudopilin GspK [Comamonas sp. BIGb0124]ROR23177.1 general secretion pathway protein K [Comamonas sp. BIGb0124]
MTRTIHRGRQRGAALLMAMLTVALVATLAAAALWRQWRGVEVETAERGRVQARWILAGALDWGRLILRQDARSGGPDHLSEPWAIPLAEARLSTFLSGNSDASAASEDDAMNAFLTGYMVDMQGRLNAYNLIENGQISESQSLAFERLFSLLALPASELERCVQQLRLSMPASAGSQTGSSGSAGNTGGDSDSNTVIAPTRFADLRRMGLSATTLARLAPYVTWLPSRTTVNLNTAPVEVLYASIANIDRAGAQKIAQARQNTHFTSVDEVRKVLGSTSTSGGSGDAPAPEISSQLHGVSSRYFQINGQVRIDDTLVGEQSIVVRNGLQIRTLQRDSLFAPLPMPSS